MLEWGRSPDLCLSSGPSFLPALKLQWTQGNTERFQNAPAVFMKHPLAMAVDSPEQGWWGNQTQPWTSIYSKRCECPGLTPGRGSGQAARITEEGDRQSLSHRPGLLEAFRLTPPASCQGGYWGPPSIQPRRGCSAPHPHQQLREGLPTPPRSAPTAEEGLSSSPVDAPP